MITESPIRTSACVIDPFASNRRSSVAAKVSFRKSTGIKPRDNNDELPLTEKGKRRQLELLRAFRELEAADLDRLFAHDLAHVYAILRAYAPPEFHVDPLEERPPGPLAGKN